jgi:DNA-damage-inducible protein J
MATLTMRVDDTIKREVDKLFNDIGLDTPTAVRMFFMAALNERGLPFAAKRPRYNAEVMQAIDDARRGRNLSGPYLTTEDAVKAMAED